MSRYVEYDDGTGGPIQIPVDDILRGLTPDQIEVDHEGINYVEGTGPQADAPTNAAPIKFRVEPAGEPQTQGTKYDVIDEDGGRRFYVGYVQHYGSRIGIARASDELIYDRFAEEARVGAWAHFIWPSVMGESNGRYLSINAWDRAHFTWGFYQLAAHTPNDNLILLMRKLLELPSAKRYFPDLILDGGKVARLTASGAKSLEREVSVPVGDGHETQIPDFMQYLNPSSRRVDNAEVITVAKFIDWARNDPGMRANTVIISLGIMKRKAKHWADRFGLHGKRPELAIWISDMFHQGRGSVAEVKAALARPTFEKQLEALSRIDTTGKHAARLRTVRAHVQTLLNEGRFASVEFGHGALAFDSDVPIG